MTRPHITHFDDNCGCLTERVEALERQLKEQEEGHIITNKGLLETIEKLETKLKSARKTISKISKVTQFDHPKSQIIGSEEYEGAWLDCIELAQRWLSEYKERS